MNERALITTTLISSCHWKTLVSSFCLRKKKIWKRSFNNNSELSQNRAEKQIIMPSNTTINWLFNDTWSYLFIACLGWKSGVFQQIVVRENFIFCTVPKRALQRTLHWISLQFTRFWKEGLDQYSRRIKLKVNNNKLIKTNLS